VWALIYFKEQHVLTDKKYSVYVRKLFAHVEVEVAIFFYFKEKLTSSGGRVCGSRSRSKSRSRGFKYFYFFSLVYEEGLGFTGQTCSYVPEEPCVVCISRAPLWKRYTVPLPA
jgi:hypothetical protein